MVRIKRKSAAMAAWGIVIAWMAFIFTLSSQPAQQSDELSKGVTEVVAQAVEKVAPGAELEVSNHIIRKNAHFFSYMFLGILSAYAFRKSGMNVIGASAFAVLLCVAYAGSDELHQMFVAGRGPGLRDVLIDSAGAGAGILMSMAVFALAGRRGRRRIGAEMVGFFKKG
ncbi:Myxococcales GC_trans_RRR domain-containing protein [Peptoclostridium litorale DSM 5388]|uniref:VanZ family protein n=1 Tax=Peptoclostridium litorale DSM 5388 TaxID=1121324 RepID=A0A069RD10_PEPLI|nr:VanZ family protein [Peptoclostridium litorale]KDR94633.1 VanZ family protein [Peptoclostridium litorale DSM 5388]SIO30544.1 Myxococcales GC_trans_RRR domain-containing protein [Peptoclostridium litorale DSM 5388]